MSSIKRLIHEVHRRSLWQVVAIYLVGSFGALQGVEFVTNNAGLPDWVPPFALILMMIGLPVVAATAFIQEGLPGREAGNESASAGAVADPTDSQSQADAGSGFDAADAALWPVNLAAGTGSLDRKSTRPPLYKRLITWRFAILGGVAAFTLLIVAVAGYFAMRAAGIGPVASLQAQGLFDEREAIVLADFRNGSSDPALGDVVTEALRVDLVQSPVLRVLDPSEIAATLERMERPVEMALTPDVAREVAERDGLKAVLVGEIGSVGSGYVLTATIRGASDGRSLAAFRVTAEDDSQLLRAIDRLSQDIREKAGESLRSIKTDPPLAQVTTSSLEALRKYAAANAMVRSGGSTDRALALLEEALDADSAFAMAWRKIGVILGNAGGNRARRIDAATRAWEYRDRLAEVERYLAIAYYESVVTGDRDATMRAYENVLTIQPDNGTALNNLGVLDARQDRWPEAETRFQRLVDNGTALTLPYTNIAFARISLNRLDDARASLAEAASRFPGSSFVRLMTALLELRTGNPDAADAALLEAVDGAASLIRSARDQAMLVEIDIMYGHLRAARAHWADYTDVLLEQDGSAGSLRAGLELINLSVMAGFEHPDATRIDALLSASDWPTMDPVARPYGEAAFAFARAGARQRVEQVLDKWEREVPTNIRGPDFDARRRLYLAILDRVEDRPAAAAEGIERSRRELHCIRCLRAELARAHEELDRTDDAIAMWQSVINERSGPGELLSPEHVLEEDGWVFPLALERLGELYDAQGDRENATAFYSRFAELWKDADPELQPRVERARNRVAALVAEGG